MEGYQPLTPATPGVSTSQSRSLKPQGFRKNLKNAETSFMSKLTGMSPEELTRKRPSMLSSMAQKMGVAKGMGTTTPATTTPMTATSTPKHSVTQKAIINAPQVPKIFRSNVR